MKYPIFIFALLISLTSFGRKYDVSITFRSLATTERVSGLKVNLEQDGKILETAYTNAAGVAEFTEVSEKDFFLNVMDSAGTYRNEAFFFHAPYKQQGDLKSQCYLRLSKDEENRFFQEREDQYRAQLADRDALTRINDSINMISCPGGPNYPGGALAMTSFLSKYVEYPKEAIDQGESGTVYLKFVVEKDGRITNISVERGVSKALDEEAIRIVHYMPKWQPALCEGEPMRCRVILPVSFDLE